MARKFWLGSEDVLSMDDIGKRLLVDVRSPTDVVGGKPNPRQWKSTTYHGRLALVIEERGSIRLTQEEQARAHDTVQNIDEWPDYIVTVVFEGGPHIKIRHQDLAYVQIEDKEDNHD